MRDEFPEQAPGETTKLKCLSGRKIVETPCIDLTEDDTTFPEVARNLVPKEFLRTQREKFEEARMKVLLKQKDTTHRQKKGKTLKAKRVALRQKIKRKLVRKKKNPT